MQTSIMPPQNLQLQATNQPSTPFAPRSDASSSPVNSIHSRPPPRTPYPPFNYPNPQHPPNGWMYQPPYYPQQNRNVPYNPGFQQQTYQPSGYHQSPYYPPNYPQMGGPGPGTIQNGYGGFQPEGSFPPNMRQPGFGNQPQGFPPPPSEINPSAPHMPVEGGGPMNGPPNGDLSYSNQYRPPPLPALTNHDPYRGQSQYPSVPNGHGRSPPPPLPQYQNYLPPDHPYAHGSGFGYPQYPQGPGMGYGFGGYGDSYAPSSMPMGPGPLPVKGLNPAAQGFNYIPSSQSPVKIEGDPDPPPPNIPDVPVFASIQPQQFAAIPNGHVEPAEAWVPPMVVNGDEHKGIEAERESIDSFDGGSLGLTQMEAPIEVSTQDSRTTSASVVTTTSTTRSTSTPAMSTSPTTSVSPASVRTPRATIEGETPVPPSPKSDPPATQLPQSPQPPQLSQTPQFSQPPQLSQPPQPSQPLQTPQPPQAQDNWNFVGPSMSGYTSPSSSTTTRSFTQALSTQATSVSAPSRRRSAFSTETGPLKLRSSRPDADGPSENAYNISLSGAIPKTVRTEQVVSPNEISRTSSKGKGKASGKKIVFAAGADGQRNAMTGVRRRDGSGMVFGSLAEEESALEVVHDSPSYQTGVGGAAKPAEVSAAVPAAVPATTTEQKASIPKVKPASWAALLKAPSKPPPIPTSASQSKIPSPAKSITSLAPEPDAGPSRLPTTPPDEPTTPRSVPTQLPPSTGASAASAPRPIFNYAAAAAAGATLTPQEDLAKLLTEGLRLRPREAPLCLPRGLINTGNMCFANTILQVLVYCTPFTELFEELRKRLKADLARRTPLLEAMIFFLLEFTPSPPSAFGTSTPRSERDVSVPNGTAPPKGKGRESRKEAFIPENVYDAVKENKRFDMIRRGYQEDAEEYLGFFLNTLHEELLLLHSRIQPSRANANNRASQSGDPDDVDRAIERPVSPGADGAGWLEVGKKQRTNVVRSSESRESAVSRLFGGTLRSVLHTPGQKDSVTLEPYQPLQLDIQSSDVVTISDALRHISEPETVPGVWSAARGTNVDATKQVYVESFPPVLILHLKRFVYDGQEQSVVKRSKPVAYGIELSVPPEIISPAKRVSLPIKYKLFGVVYHHGTSASGGHYTVGVARQDAAGWIHFDDEIVQPVSTDQIVVSRDEAVEGRAGLIGGRERCAYLLFYQRVRS